MTQWLAALAVALACGAEAATLAGGEWTFRVLLGDQPIGEHRFSVKAEGDEREVRSEARFEVKVLGFIAYRYRHTAVERWRGDCLVSMRASTDDDGKSVAVTAQRDGDALSVITPSGTARLPGCTMSFAYWNPALATQRQLLNAQTGELTNVRIESLGESSIDVRGAPTPARHLRLSGADRPIDLWYSAGGDWLALESTVAGGRRLRYRLE